MDCPRCGSDKLNPVSPYLQNRKFRCEECKFVSSIDHYEFEYEIFHKGICGRCKQEIQVKE